MHAAAEPMTPPDDTTNAPLTDPLADEAERTWAMFNHLVVLLSLGSVNILGTVGAIVMWRLRAARSPFLDDHGREATNFCITLAIYFVGVIVVGVVTMGVLAPPAMLALAALCVVGSVRGALAANRGEFYRYPMTIRFIDPPADDQAA